MAVWLTADALLGTCLEKSILEEVVRRPKADCRRLMADG
jgi:hypothetical protein